MRKLIATLIGLGFSVAALGQDLLQCLDPHLARSLVAPSTTNNEVPVTSDVPAELSGYVVPAGFEWIGTLAGEIRKTIALKTTLPAEAAESAFVESLAAAGWTKGNSPSPMPPVFSFSDSPGRSTQMCHADLSGSLTVRDVDGTRYVNLIYSAGSGSAGCRPSPLSARPPFMDEMRSETPTLRFPAGTTSTGGMSSSGSGRDFRTTATVAGDVSPSAIVDHVSPQMREQGWSIDSQWAGRYGAGATWSRQSNAGQLLGTIEIVRRDDDTMEAQFRLRTL